MAPMDARNFIRGRTFRWGLPVVLLIAVGATWLAVRRPPVDRTLRTYEAPRRVGAIVIDGVPDEAGWARAPVAGPFILSSGRGPAPRACTARLLWDDQALYLSFEAADEDLLSPHRRRDEDLFTQDVVEVFLDPGGDGIDYYEIEVSPRGVVFDALFPSHRKDLARSRTWNAPGLTAAARIHGTVDDAAADTGWSAELRIPFAGIRHASRSPPRPGDAWRMNLYRNDRHADGKADYTAWTAPVVGDFHAFARFGTLVFVAGPKGEDP